MVALGGGAVSYERGTPVLQVFMAGVTKRFGKAAKLQLPNQFDRSIHDKRSEVWPCT